MHRYSLPYKILIGLLSMFFACRDSVQSDNSVREISRHPSADFLRDIPLYKEGPSKGDTDYSYKVIKQSAFQLELDSLELGYDSLQVRIWLGHSMAVIRHLVILSKRRNIWNGQLLTLDNSGMFIGKKENRIVKPRSGWNNFISSLIELEILNLPNADDLAGYNGCGTDGLPYYIEWATPKRYRFYTYCNIEGNLNKFWQAGNLLKFSHLLEREFGFKYTK